MRVVSINVSYVLPDRPCAGVSATRFTVGFCFPAPDSGIKPEVGFMPGTVLRIDTGGERRVHNPR